MKTKIYFLSALAAAFSIESQSQVLCESGFAGEFPCLNVDLMAHMTIDEIGGGANLNDIWGWTSPVSGKEYALVGRSTGTAFVDVSIPNAPVYIGNLATYSSPSLWRGIKVIGNYAYIGSEAGNHGMQIFDLLQLDEAVDFPVEFSQTAHYDLFSNSHTINVNEETGYVYAVGTNTFNGGLHIVDVNDPLNPTIAGSLEFDGYTHETQVVNYNGPDQEWQGKEVAFLFNATKFSIADVTDKTDINLISSKTYDTLGYVHQGWLTEDHKFLLMDDELDETGFGINTRTLIWNVQDLDNPVHIGSFNSELACSDHNQYVRSNYVFQSNYSGGLRILNIENIANASLFEAGFFDTEPLSNAVGYNGSWSNYPFFESGNVIVTSMYNGFFVVKPKPFFFTSVEESKSSQNNKLRTYPNPAISQVNVEIPAWAGHFQSKISICDLMGVEQSGTNIQWLTPGRHTLDVSGLNAGYYIIRVNHPAGILHSAIIVE